MYMDLQVSVEGDGWLFDQAVGEIERGDDPEKISS
jgi:hypothetical protein